MVHSDIQLYHVKGILLNLVTPITIYAKNGASMACTHFLSSRGFILRPLVP